MTINDRKNSNKVPFYNFICYENSQTRAKLPQWTLGSLKFPWKISHLLIHKQAEPTTLLDNGRRQLVFIVGARGLPHTALSPQLSRRNSASEPSMRTGSCCWRHAHIWYILIVFIQKGLITKNKKIKTEGKEKWCVQSCRIQSHANKLILVTSYGIISPALDGRSGGRKITQLIRELGSIGSMTIESPSDAWTARREPRGYGFGLVETLNNPMLSTHSTLSAPKHMPFQMNNPIHRHWSEYTYANASQMYNLFGDHADNSASSIHVWLADYMEQHMVAYIIKFYMKIWTHLQMEFKKGKPVFVTSEGLEDFRCGGSKTTRLGAEGKLIVSQPKVGCFRPRINKIAFHCQTMHISFLFFLFSFFLLLEYWILSSAPLLQMKKQRKVASNMIQLLGLSKRPDLSNGINGNSDNESGVDLKLNHTKMEEIGCRKKFLSSGTPFDSFWPCSGVNKKSIFLGWEWI